MEAFSKYCISSIKFYSLPPKVFFDFQNWTSAIDWYKPQFPDLYCWKKMPKHLFAFISSFCHSIIDALKAASHLTNKETVIVHKIGNESCWKELLYKDTSFSLLYWKLWPQTISLQSLLILNSFAIQLIQSFRSSSSYFELHDLFRDLIFSGLVSGFLYIFGFIIFRLLT